MSSTGTANLSRLGAYVLCWLACHVDGGTARSIAVALFKEKGREDDQTRLVVGELASLERAGLVKRARRASFTITPAGKESALGALGGGKLPAKASWRVVKSRLETCLLEKKASTEQTPAVAALPGAAGDDAAQALAKAFRLAVGPAAPLQQVVDVLAWQALGIETTEPFTLTAVLEVLLSRLAGSPTRLSLGQAIELLVAKGAPAAPPQQPLPEPKHLPEDEAAFAARVLSAAKASKTGRFGGDRVFISHVVRQLAREGVAIGDVETFKARLVTAHRRDRLSLSRADLVEAMKPEDVDESETRYRSATFHFVQIG